MAAAVFTLTKSGSRNLGGGAMIVYGTITTDTGDYATNGIAPSPTFASLDRISGRAPDLVLFSNDGGYNFYYSSAKIVALAQRDSAGTTYDLKALAEYPNATAFTAVTVKFVAFWFPKVP
jgi:hypothetical protein